MPTPDQWRRAYNRSPYEPYTGETITTQGTTGHASRRGPHPLWYRVLVMLLCTVIGAMPLIACKAYLHTVDTSYIASVVLWVLACAWAFPMALTLYSILSERTDV